MSHSKTICTVCNYIYEEAPGEHTVNFEALPDGWQCPDCGSSKDMFQPCSCVQISFGPLIAPGIDRQAPASDMGSIPVGRLIADQPGRACVLEQYGIDYCCGGKKSLAEACSRKGVSLNEVLRKLQEADRKKFSSSEQDWSRCTLKELIEHIVSTYHQPLRQELPRLARGKGFDCSRRRSS